MKLATKQQEQVPDAISKALELFEEKRTLRKQHAELSRDVRGLERGEEAAAGQVRRAEGYAARGDNSVIDIRKARAVHKQWQDLLEARRVELAALDAKLAAVDAQLVELDAGAIQAAVDSLVREQRLIERRLRRGFYEELSQERAAAERREEIGPQLKALEPVLSDIRSLQRARDQRATIRANFPAIEQAVEKFEASMRAAMGAHNELRELTKAGSWLPDFSIFLVASAQRPAQQLLEKLREEIES